MYKVLGTLRVGDKYCVSLEGDPFLLKNGLILVDENKCKYTIESIGMVKYENVEDHKRFSGVLLQGGVENIGKTLFITTDEC